MTDVETEVEASRRPPARAGDPIEGFLDIPMRIRVELGRRNYRCEDVAALRTGSIVSLKRSAGENVTLLLNGVRLGAGEIVVIEDTMGVRITEIAGRRAGTEG